MSKRLTLLTNIGDLDYTINVNIPSNMLNQCHDVIMRPPFETLFYYLAFIVSFGFTIFLLLLAYYESKWLHRIETNSTRHIVVTTAVEGAVTNSTSSSIEEENRRMNVQDMRVEYQIQLTNKSKHFTTKTTSDKAPTTTGKSKLKLNEIKYKSKLPSRPPSKQININFTSKSNDIVNNETHLSPPPSPLSKNSNSFL